MGSHVFQGPDFVAENKALPEATYCEVCWHYIPQFLKNGYCGGTKYR